MARHVFVTGGTGYLGRPLIERLTSRGHGVTALVRPGSEGKLPASATPLVGNALDAIGWASRVPPADTLVHLVGTPHPNPSKAAEFQAVDLPSIKASVAAAVEARIAHVVYVSVAQPAPVMRAYIAVRAAGEKMIRAAGLRATILRPWYVLGPRHWWPYALVPVYALLRMIPSTRAGATRLGLVTQAQMLGALVHAIESPPVEQVRVMEVSEIVARGS